MIIGVLLVLGLQLPDGRIDAWTVVVPNMRVCEAAMKEFLTAPDRISPAIPSDPAYLRRSAACLTIPAQGKDL